MRLLRLASDEAERARCTSALAELSSTSRATPTSALAIRQLQRAGEARRAPANSSSRSPRTTWAGRIDWGRCASR